MVLSMILWVSCHTSVTLVTPTRTTWWLASRWGQATTYRPRCRLFLIGTSSMILGESVLLIPVWFFYFLFLFLPSLQSLSFSSLFLHVFFFFFYFCSSLCLFCILLCFYMNQIISLSLFSLALYAWSYFLSFLFCFYYQQFSQVYYKISSVLPSALVY